MRYNYVVDTFSCKEPLLLYSSIRSQYLLCGLNVVSLFFQVSYRACLLNALCQTRNLLIWKADFSRGMLSASAKLPVDFQNKVEQLSFDFWLVNLSIIKFQTFKFLSLKKKIRGKYQFPENLLSNIKTILRLLGQPIYLRVKN